MNALRIYANEGCDPETRRVAMCDAATHIAANDHLAYEAGLLLKFDAADGVPTSLDGMILESNGTDENGEYYRYVERGEK